MQKRKNGAASPVPSIWPGHFLAAWEWRYRKARHLAVSAVHEKGEPRKGRPIGHKKGIPKDASVLGQIAFEVLRLSKGHPAEIAFLPNPRRVAAYRICVRRQGLSK